MISPFVLIFHNQPLWAGKSIILDSISLLMSEELYFSC